jgi:2-polyprenyl-3-methyl-5-hydroxy-6-metoxy-1,4-benzoquinol methylase
MTEPRTTVAPGVVTGNVYDKYGSSNPVVRLLMNGFFRSFDDLLSGLPVKSILEVGCGEGEIGHRIERLFPEARYTGVDIGEEIIAEAQRRFPHLEFATLSIYDVNRQPFDADLVIATEVFEHLERPDEAMNALFQIPFRYLLVSVPREPVWRMLNVARGKYLSDWGNTPGHVNHWSRLGFKEFLGRYRGNIEISKMNSPFPWTMALLKRLPG